MWAVSKSIGLSARRLSSGLVISTYVNGRTLKRKTPAKDVGIEVYGRIPEQADPRIRVDEGRPVVLDEPSGPVVQPYDELSSASSPSSRPRPSARSDLWRSVAASVPWTHVIDNRRRIAGRPQR